VPDVVYLGGDEQLYGYHVTLPEALILPGGVDLWISIANLTDAELFWVWQSASAPYAPDALYPGLSGAWIDGAPYLNVGDLAFTLEGNLVSVPEPASGILFAVGAMAALYGRRRRSA
jgi:hypothetical protein